MPSKTETLQEHFNVQTPHDAFRVYRQHVLENPMPMSLRTKLQVPYEAPSHPDLLSLDEIEIGMKKGNLTGWSAGNDVCIVGRCVVKRGCRAMILQEAEDQLFLQANSQVRTPKVYAVYTRNEDDQPAPVHYMVSEFIEGKTLTSEQWMAFSDGTRTKILSRLCEPFSHLRSTPHQGYYGRVHNQGWCPSFPLLRKNGTEMCGPYNSYKDYISAAYTAAHISGAMFDREQQEFSPEAELHLSRFESILSTCKGMEPTFTHLDPQLKNMIVQPLPVGSSEEEAEDWAITLIDWEESGWYPGWMQAVTLSQRLSMCNGNRLNIEACHRFVNTILRNFEDPFTEQVTLHKDLGRFVGYKL